MNWKAMLKAILTIPLVIAFGAVFMFIEYIFPHIWTCLLGIFIFWCIYQIYKE